MGKELFQQGGGGAARAKVMRSFWGSWPFFLTDHSRPGIIGLYPASGEDLSGHPPWEAVATAAPVLGEESRLPPRARQVASARNQRLSPRAGVQCLLRLTGRNLGPGMPAHSFFKANWVLTNDFIFKC